MSRDDVIVVVVVDDDDDDGGGGCVDRLLGLDERATVELPMTAAAAAVEEER